ncbi:guided entry of tail-anchored proteins factor 1 [Thiothrix winogradskyi]|uniref:Guided entry of tail-anchored proteins factor 1 n=1 Tax=Thiothrix winogradskyi TaxID=96472 RepID=A0ABY3T4E5_9GAMM|nr:guided entry of tail-anchored proteins factor 1 [Thiothrix winogradskyi]UJS26260.1 guided entry of tail-anchored proteins factor 1 [Thiothrix winogradskyi]
MIFAEARSLKNDGLDALIKTCELKPLVFRPIVSSGSRCGHDKESPRFQLIEDYAQKHDTERDIYGHKWRPAILHRIMGDLKEFYSNPEKHPSMCFHLVRNVVKARGANLRLIKSQFREGMTRYLAVCLRFLDLNTMLIGTYDRFFKFHNFTIDYLAQQAGISVTQAERAHQFWKQKGVLVSEGNGDDKVCVDNGDGTFSGRASPKRISAHIFSYFGLKDALRDQRQKASERLSKKKEEAANELSSQEEAARRMRHEKLMRDISEVVTGKAIDASSLPKKGDFRSLINDL